MNLRAWYPGLPVDSRMNGTKLMRVYLANLAFSSRLAMWPGRPLAADVSPGLEENGVTMAVLSM